AVDRQEDALGAQRAGGPERHRRMDAEDPCLVARGADNAALVWAATTHDHGLAAKLRPIALLDGGEERVEVDVKDRPVDRRLGAHTRNHRTAVDRFRPDVRWVRAGWRGAV